MKPTIKDVARQAKVSVATVSRVLNKSGYFDEDTARRVHDAIHALGYRRNIHWQRLKNNASRTLCFLLGNRAGLNSMQMRLLVACERVCKERGYDLVFSRFDYDPGARRVRLELPRLLAENGLVDGVILIGRHGHAILRLFDEAGLPWALLGNNFEGDFQRIPHFVVGYDDESGSYEAVSYLARLGHRRIAFIGNTSIPWFRRRHSGYQRAIRAHGLSSIAVESDWGVTAVEYGRLATAELLRLPAPPTAVFASNDEIAAGAWKELVQRGIRIPQQISLCGFGDREEFQILEPALTSLAVFPEKLGEELAGLLLRRLADPNAKIASKLYPCRMVERASCSPPLSRLAAASSG